MKNRFNRLTSKEWLPFQKSWFRFDSDTKLLKENILFFSKAEKCNEKVYYYGHQYEDVSKICKENTRESVYAEDYQKEVLQFAILDLRNDIDSFSDLNDYSELVSRVINLTEIIFEKLEDRRFLCIFIQNQQHKEKYYPYAWDLARRISSILSLKDEKIACQTETEISDHKPYFKPGQEHFYCLYFRKDENSQGKYRENCSGLFSNNCQILSKKPFLSEIPSWFILKPAPRKKNEVLHPAKYPEELVNMFLNTFTAPGDNVLDPMSGTGSTQVAALKSGRNAYGTELSNYFMAIAVHRCNDLVNPLQKELFTSNEVKSNYRIINKDARLITADDFPAIDYMITSPPYWDMLNMKGAENQAKRLEKGLMTNYSESDVDLGNMADYQLFIDELTEVYFNIISIMKSGSYLTIVVKNIKKKGRNYPFAWDLSRRLMEKVILLPEVFWCQDDISIAPYGYGNTFVSNTFHQYCLNFMKP